MARSSDPISLMDLAPELNIQIFQALPNLWSAIALRQTCRELNTIYLANEISIRNKYRDRLVAAVDDYYTFLVSFYLDHRALRRPPPSGWPAIPLEKTSRPDKDFLLDVARHLPYIAGGLDDDRLNIDYKCRPIDYSSGYSRREDVMDLRYEWSIDDTTGFMRQRDPSIVDQFLQLTEGYESGGISLFLDTMTGRVIVDYIRMTTREEGDVAEYFEDLKEKFRSLTFVPVVGHEQHGVDEKLISEYGHLEQADFLAQTEPAWTIIDTLWARSLYREFGWPGPGYQKEEALRAIEQYRQQRRG
ncbi:hypothetical protein SLS62_004423 [Diatrype stigma]|uniref:F-box domain-containing protein n=1 Tax=Diatrype stigma TaxID=117547 RepID=A0AAN9UWJ9_9PEZI